MDGLGEEIRLVVVLGPTASGKSELAVRLAEAFSGEIINADSMQVYRGMEIGTAKPPPELLRRVPHHLLGVVDPDQPFSAADFRKRAAEAIRDIHDRGKRVFVVGGTGLYIKALTRGLVESPGGDGAVRAELEELAARAGRDELHRRLARVDPVTAERLHPNDLVRVIRALEVHTITGRPISSLREGHGFRETCYRSLKIGISLEREELYRRIDERVERMMEQGLKDEVAGLLAGGYGPGLKPMRSIGYRQICSHLAGEITLDEAVRLIKRDTRHYAKRQQTWFKGDFEINWFEYAANIAIISKTVIKFYV